MKAEKQQVPSRTPSSVTAGATPSEAFAATFVRVSCPLVLLVAGAGAFLLCFPQKPSQPAGQTAASRNLSEVLALLPNQLTKFDPALANLLCAQGLPGAEALDLSSSLAVLDQWATRVRSETERHLYRFRAAPAEYHNSEAYFRMLIMAVVLYEDSAVRYNPALITNPGAPGDTSAFFRDSRDLFLHGLCGDRRMGTCSSMPVLYLAIGRRLGYPLKLVTTKSHVFLRWDTPEERFNLEATGKGMNRYDDDHFKQWPFPVSDEEIKNDGYLKSLTPPEELALFLSLRAQCLKVAGLTDEAADAYRAAIRFAPESRPYRLLLAALENGETATGTPVSHSALPLPPPGPAAFPSTVHPSAPADPNPLRQVR